MGRGERVVAAVSEEPGAAAVVRAAKRRGDAPHAPLTAVHVETSREASLDDERRRRLGDTLALAADLGATLVGVHGRTIGEGLREQLR